MKKQTNGLRFALVTVLLFSMTLQQAGACTRILYKTGNGTYITARSMDWIDPELTSDLWVFPQGIKRNGGGSKNALTWTSKYGSVITSFYGTASADGMNEKGLVGNMQYLTDSDYGDPAKTGKPTISIGAWLQYFLDNYATVEEAVAANFPFGHSSSMEHLLEQVVSRLNRENAIMQKERNETQYSTVYNCNSLSIICGSTGICSATTTAQ